MKLGQLAMPAKSAGSARVGGLPIGSDTGRAGGASLLRGAITGIVGHVDAVEVSSRESAPWAWTLGSVGAFTFTRPGQRPCSEARSASCRN